MLYAIRHFTRYRYSHSVWQSMMEVRMHPKSEGNALFCFSAVGKPASPHFWLYRFLWQSGAPLRLAFPP
jgi:Bacterial transglutaminase-like N-terminal region